MIKSLSIHNFQKHEKLKIPVGRITSIVGPTDVGKSAVVRTLRWIIRNQPNGLEFLREGAKEVKCKIKVDGSLVTRSRTKSENTYYLGKEEFKSFGNTVPDPINQVLQTSDLNFQGQHDSPFWFALSAGEVSRQLNSIINLEVIDKVQALSLQEVRKVGGQITESKTRLQDAEVKVEELSKCLKFQKAIKVIEKQYASIEDLTKKESRLRRLLEQITRTSEDIIEVPSLDLSSTIEKIQDIQNKYEVLEELLERIEGHKITLKSCSDSLEQLEQEFHSLVDNQNCPICGNKIKSQ